MWSLGVLSAVGLSAVAEGQEPADSNRVLKVMLNRLAARASDDCWTGEPKQVTSGTSVRTLRDFFLEGQDARWTLADCQGVFNGYLSCLSTNDARLLTARDLYFAKLALKQCDLLEYTNAVSAYSALALNPNGVCRERAIRLAVKCSGVNANATRFVETIFTNVVCYSDAERETAASTYATEVLEYASSALRNPAEQASAVGMFYRNRLLGSVSCYPIDAVLCAGLPGYNLSSNRLLTVDRVLSSSDIDEDTRSDFTSIKNQLLTSGQPLRQLNLGEAGE